MTGTENKEVTRRVRVLVTNDDGVDSPGIWALAQAAAEQGHEPVVAAPAWNSSGASASLTGVTDDDGRFLFEERDLDALAGVRVYAVQAAPAFIVRMGLRGAFGPPPDLVLSGVNDGPNTGHAILHSGTVGAALTAGTHGCRAIAVSMGMGGDGNFATAAEIGTALIGRLAGAPAPMVLNVNVPDLPAQQVRGLVRAPLASFGAVQTHVTEVGRGYVHLEFEEIDPSGEPGSDAALLAAGWATVTALNPVCEAAGVDLSGFADEPPVGAARA